MLPGRASRTARKYFRPSTTMIDIRKHISAKQPIPDLPLISLKVLETIGNPGSTMDDLAAVIKASPSMTAKLLSIANSSFFSRKGEVTTLNSAISILGQKAVASIALSVSIIEGMTDGGAHQEISDYWERSLFHAVAAKMLAERVGLRDAEEAFVVGLLSDISYIFIFRTFHEQYLALVDPLLSESERLAMEMELFGMTHPEMSRVLLAHYRIPDRLLTAIAAHHTEVADLGSQEADLEKFCRVAYSAAHVTHLFYQGVRGARGIKAGIEHALGVPAHETDRMLADIGAKVKELSAFFGFAAEKFPSYFDILERANEELLTINLEYEELLQKLKEEKETNEHLTRKLEETNRKLLEFALRDPLTGAYNRRFLNEVLDKKMADARRYMHHLAVVVADIDHFKKINDTYGHDAGDHVLKTVVATIGASLRAGDVLARTGGEEFLLVLQVTDAAAAMLVAERVRARLERTPIGLPDGGNVRVTMSLGVALFQPEHGSRDQLIKAADNGLYEAKHAGRNLVRYWQPPNMAASN